MIQSLVDAVKGALEQDAALLRTLPDEHYTRPCAACFGSSIGAHIRHNLDHFDRLLSGIDDGRIDYESRKREGAIEADRREALAAIERVVSGLDRCLEHDPGRPLLVREESEDGGDGPAELRWLPSSLGRELQFVLGHTVHHNALIATIAAGIGVELPEGFGIAPSTRRYKRRVSGPGR